MLTIPFGSAAWSQEANPNAMVVPEGINDNVKNPDLNVDDWLERCEVESREVYGARKEVMKACDIMPGERIAECVTADGIENLTTVLGTDVSI